MKILDASTIIAVFNEINCPELIDKIIQLGHDLAIPSHIMNSELLEKSTLKITNGFIKQNKIQILNHNTIEEIREFQKDFPGLGLGECDSMLSYQKINNGKDKVYCIFDDGKARSKASELNIEFTGLIGLLKLIKVRNIMDSQEIEDVVQMLKQSNFRFPAGVVI